MYNKFKNYILFNYNNKNKIINRVLINNNNNRLIKNKLMPSKKTI